MFSQQYTRQLSTSPPPFSYASIPGTESMSFPPYQHPSNYCAVPVNSGNGGIDMAMYPQYLPPMQQSYMPPMSAGGSMKHEFYADDEMSPFSMSYASMAGVDVSAASQPYHQDAAAYVSNSHKPHHHPLPYPQQPHHPQPHPHSQFQHARSYSHPTRWPGTLADLEIVFVRKQTPPLLESFEYYSKAASPLDEDPMMFPRTPASMPRTPPTHLYGQA